MQNTEQNKPAEAQSFLTGELAADEEEFEIPRFDDEYIEKQLRRVAALRGDGDEKASLAYQAAECIARLRIATNGVVALADVPDNELPGMWERADFM